MTITLEPEFERKVQEAAARAGLDINGFVKATLLQKMEAQNDSALDKAARKERIRLDAEAMAADPLCMQDIEETMEAYKYIDSETARMMDEEEREPPARRSAMDILTEAPGQRVFKTAAEVDAYVKEEPNRLNR